MYKAQAPFPLSVVSLPSLFAIGAGVERYKEAEGVLQRLCRWCCKGGRAFCNGFGVRVFFSMPKNARFVFACCFPQVISEHRGWTAADGHPPICRSGTAQKKDSWLWAFLCVCVWVCVRDRRREEHRLSKQFNEREAAV